MLLPVIKRNLRAGKHPREFGAQAHVGGAQREVVWLYGNYIIKDRLPAWQLDTENNICATPVAKRDLWAIPRRVFARAGVEPPQQWYVGEWVIQVYYRALNATELTHWSAKLNAHDFFHRVLVSGRPRKVRIDIHTANVGIHPLRGTVHCFDW